MAVVVGGRRRRSSSAVVVGGRRRRSSSAVLVCGRGSSSVVVGRRRSSAVVGGRRRSVVRRPSSVGRRPSAVGRRSSVVSLPLLRFVFQRNSWDLLCNVGLGLTRQDGGGPKRRPERPQTTNPKQARKKESWNIVEMLGNESLVAFGGGFCQKAHQLRLVSHCFCAV